MLGQEKSAKRYDRLDICRHNNQRKADDIVGIGMGGQFDYAGLWIDSDFLHGHSKAGPLCTTYQSPRLSPTETFEIEEVEGERVPLILTISAKHCLSHIGTAAAQG